jgi:hypothetical protein
MDAFEVEHEFPRIGHRVMLLNARAVFYADHARTTLLLTFEDVTERRAIEREKEELLRQTEELLQQKDVLLRELEHRGLMYATECRLPGRSLSGRRDLLSASCALRGSLFDE